MTAEEHNKTLSTLWFVYGGIHGLTLLGLLGLVLIFKFGSVAGDLLSTSWMIGGAIALVILMLAVGVLPVIAGFGFAKRQAWVKPFAFALAIVSLVNVPVGTALGIYSIKFFRSDAGVQLYGGRARVDSSSELDDALGRAKPLMNVAQRLK